MLKAFVINNSERKLEDLGDVLQIARFIGKQVFKTSRRVSVKRIWHVAELQCYVVLVEGMNVQKPKVLRHEVTMANNE